MKAIEVAAAAAAVSMLCACGGGGGIREVTFTSFPVTNQTVAMAGMSETIGGSNSGGGTQVTGIEANSTFDGGSSTARLTYAASPTNPTGMSVSTPTSSISFGPGTVNCSFPPTCTADNASSVLVVINPAFAPPFGSWNYQTYGVWLQQTSPTTFRAGAISAGAVTPGSAVPTLGSATFGGLATGFYVDPTGVGFATAADMSATVTFSNVNPSIAFSTANTTINPLDGSGSPIAALQLNLSGALTYPPGSSQFSGPVTSGSGMTGDANGRFYGPAAQEIGGVYSLTGTLLERMIGAFGGKRP